MSTPLATLKTGVRHFQQTIYPAQAERYQHAATTPQQPHTLVIACADSRVDVETITSSGPGDVFITRNVGNMVPVHGETASGVAAVIEYAVSALKVQHIVVCGHSDCGAMKALLHPEAAATLPDVKSWLTHGPAGAEDGKTALPALTEQNVLLQLDHLKTHPAVASALDRGALTLSGWVYEIGSGDVRIAEDGSRHFEVVAPAAAEVNLAL